MKDAVLTRCAVDGDVGKIKVVATIFGFKRKIVAIDFDFLHTIVHIPVCAFHLYDITVVFVLVHKREDALCTHE